MARGIETGAIIDRTQALYVSEEYKAFFLTGQMFSDLSSKQDNPRPRRGDKAYITVHPFNSLSEEEVELLKTEAQPLDGKSNISITCNRETLEVFDKSTRTVSMFPVEELNEDVKARLTAPQKKPSEQKPSKQETSSKVLHDVWEREVRGHVNFKPLPPENVKPPPPPPPPRKRI